MFLWPLTRRLWTTTPRARVHRTVLDKIAPRGTPRSTAETASRICIFEDVTGLGLPDGPAQSNDHAVVKETADGIVLSWNRGGENSGEGSSAEPFHCHDELPHVLQALSRGERVYALKDPVGKVVGAIAFSREIRARERAEAASRRNLAFTLERIADISLAPANRLVVGRC